MRVTQLDSKKLPANACIDRYLGTHSEIYGQSLQTSRWRRAVSPRETRWRPVLALQVSTRGLEKSISLGVYPHVSLKLARARRDEARALLTEGVDPAAKRKAEKNAQADSFQAVAQEWLAKRGYLHPGTVHRDYDRLRKFIYPYLGNRPIDSIEAPVLLEALRRIEARGRLETAHRTKSVCGRVFRYAIATGRAKRDVSADLRGALASPATRNLAALTDPTKVGELLRAIDGYDGHDLTAQA